MQNYSRNDYSIIARPCSHYGAFSVIITDRCLHYEYFTISRITAFANFRTAREAKPGPDKLFSNLQLVQTFIEPRRVTQ